MLEHYEKDKLLEKLSSCGDISNKTKKGIREKTTAKSRSERSRQSNATRGHKPGAEFSLEQKRRVWEIHKRAEYRTDSGETIRWNHVIAEEGQEGQIFAGMTPRDLGVKFKNMKKQDKAGTLNAALGM